MVDSSKPCICLWCILLLPHLKYTGNKYFKGIQFYEVIEFYLNLLQLYLERKCFVQEQQKNFRETTTTFPLFYLNKIGMSIVSKLDAR